MAYGLHDLELTGIQVKTILSVRISHRPGEHGVMELTADLGETNQDIPVYEAGSGQPVALFGVREGKREVLFCGVLTNLSAESMGKSFYVNITAMTYSYLMDIQKKSRSFQDTSMTYGALVTQIVKEYPGAECQILFADRPLLEIAVQYQETDWQFLKRMLSVLHVPFVSSEVRDSICVYAGSAQIPAKPDVISVQDVQKDMDGLSYWKETGEAVQDIDFITYRIRLDNHISLYSGVFWRGRELVTEEVCYETEGSALYETVILRKKDGILQKEIYPMHLVGSALEGSILNVKGEKVQIHLKIDDLYPGKDCYWFPFSTPSASLDGSGWYCMPEVGDQVRIYFPTKKTGEVIAISAVSTYDPSALKAAQKSGNSEAGSGLGGSGGLGGSNGAGGSGSSGGGNGSGGGYAPGSAAGAGAAGGAAAMAAGTAGTAANKGQAGTATGETGKDKMEDPATKYLRTASGQEVKLGPKGIEVLCSGETVKIEILKSGRINLYAKDTIRITAKNRIHMKSKATLGVDVKKNAEFESGMGGSLKLDKKGNVTIDGTEVHMN